MGREDEAPQHGPLPEEEGIPDLQESHPAKRKTGDAQEGLVPPGERPQGLDSHGVTAAEQREGRPISEKLDLEVPDDDPVREDRSPGSGRLVQQSEEGVDREEQEVASESEDTSAPSAEEEAVRVTKDPPGLTGPEGSPPDDDRS